jgi:2-oxo-4-hydroxy-4-carboxy--5-ureidoimidazoline (OHCU) decarboxylase
MLNAFYEETFPNLRFITFVNGRSRAEIVPELEVCPLLSL